MSNNVIFGRLNRKLIPVDYTGIDTETANTIVDNENKTIEVNVLGIDGVVKYNEEQHLTSEEKERAKNNIGVIDYVGGTTETAEVHISGDTISVDVTDVGEVYTAGDNIQISADNVISATDTTYDSLPASEGGSSVSLVTTGEKYTWNNKQDTLVSGTNIKTINNESVLGSGNISIVSYHSFNPSWVTNGTTEDFCNSIVSDSSAVAGMTYLGKLMCSDLPGGLVQGEAVVEIISDDVNGKAIDIVLTSVTNSPYRWTYSRAKVNGSYVNTGWKAYQLEITSSNKLSSDLVDDTNHTNKFVTTSEKTTWNGKQNALTFDSTPTQDSTNPITSGGVYTALTGKQDVIDATHKLSADLVDDANTTNKFVTESDKTTWNNKSNGVIFVDWS